MNNRTCISNLGHPTTCTSPIGGNKTIASGRSFNNEARKCPFSHLYSCWVAYVMSSWRKVGKIGLVLNHNLICLKAGGTNRRTNKCTRVTHQARPLAHCLWWSLAELIPRFVTAHGLWLSSCPPPSCGRVWDKQNHQYVFVSCTTESVPVWSSEDLVRMIAWHRFPDIYKK